MKKITTGRDTMNDFAPKFAQLNDDILFGEIWSREEQLSLRDRSLITISAFVGSGILDDPTGFLCRLAEGMGGIADLKGDLP